MQSGVNFLYQNDVDSAVAHVLEVVRTSLDRIEVFLSDKHTISFKGRGGDYIYILTSGRVELCNSNNNLTIVDINRPAVLWGGDSDSDCLLIRAASDSILYRIDSVNFINLISHNNLWKEISMIFAWYIGVYISRECVFSKMGNNYDMVKFYLEELWENNKENLDRISIFSFIRGRVLVSRSSLNNILKDLSKGGYIKTSRGKLLFLKKLPQRY